jgi:hypothetical protein
MDRFQGTKYDVQKQNEVWKNREEIQTLDFMTLTKE